jgi:hypothetical protein
MKVLRVALPPYQTPRYEWRKEIHKAVVREMRLAKIAYSPNDRFGVEIELRMADRMFRFHDVDNRLKDILDALQGRMGGPKNVHAYTRLIDNDNQVTRVVIQKVLLPPGSRGGGRLKVVRLSDRG